MFRSIRWRFILIYFLLVFLAMAIVGFFIIDNLEKIQLDNITKSMKSHISSIIASSSYLQEDDWYDYTEEINTSVKENIQIGYNENLYIILNNKDLEIIGSTIENVVNKNPYDVKRINNFLLEEALMGEISETIPPEEYDGIQSKVKHMAYPVKNQQGNITGIIYLTYSLESVYETVDNSKVMLTRATILALIITIIIGFFIATSITKPIKDVTLKAKEMSKGNFDQFVDVKSTDEIGQLGMMFNYLTKELKNRISELSQEKSKIETTFNYMADGVITIDLKGKIIHANPVSKNILNVDDTKKDLGNTVISELSPDLSLENIEKNSWIGDKKVEIKGSIYNINYAPYKNDKGEVGGVIYVMQDITEQQKLEDMRKEFIANVSHELKTPITTIKSYSETLLSGALEYKETTREFVGIIDAETDRMSRLVQDLLKLSRMEYNEESWKKTLVNPGEILESVYKKLRIRANEKNQRIKTNIDKNTSKVFFDREGLEQILQNIIANSIKYTKENGVIIISCLDNKENVVILIEDNGIGIPKEDMGRIFERFYRVDKARSRDMGGTGLGLAIAKRIADDHKSKIEINSQVNVGTQVKITIPAAEKNSGDKYEDREI
ncbi:MAG: ATP-binding protein [Bacillota bacterium]|nr:ATP-binding protein [Bacillota bacterium]